jgi:chemotaxis signal transduction protein
MTDLLEDDVAVRLFCSFRTQGRLYGIDAAQVREISTQVMCTPVPQAPPGVRGLANLRSRIFLVIDIRPVLGLDPAACTPDSRLIVLKPHLCEDLGILVEEGGDIIRVPAGQIEENSQAGPASLQTSALAMRGAGIPGDSFTDGPAMVTVGVCKLENELMTIVDSMKVVETLKASMQ